jgi:hypothetical protein
MELALTISLTMQQLVARVITTIVDSLDFSKEENSQYIPIIFF